MKYLEYNKEKLVPHSECYLFKFVKRIKKRGKGNYYLSESVIDFIHQAFQNFVLDGEYHLEECNCVKCTRDRVTEQYERLKRKMEFMEFQKTVKVEMIQFEILVRKMNEVEKE